MARITQLEIDSLPDILLNGSFEMQFPGLPNGANGKFIRLKCRTTKLIGYSSKRMQVYFAGNVRYFPGAIEEEKQVDISFLEDSNFETFKTLEKVWNFFYDKDGNAKGTPEEYSFDAKLIIYDATGKAACTTKYRQMFLEKISEVEMDGENNSALIVTGTFSYLAREVS